VIEVAQSEEEQLLRTTAARFVDSEYPRAAVRDLLATPSGIPDRYNQQIGALGWLSLLVPESGEPGLAEQASPSPRSWPRSAGGVCSPGRSSRPAW